MSEPPLTLNTTHVYAHKQQLCFMYSNINIPKLLRGLEVRAEVGKDFLRKATFITKKSDTLSVRCQTYGNIESFGASPPLHLY